MVVIHTNESPEQTEQDRPELERLHAKALFYHPTWRMFGGVIWVGDRQYQVEERVDERKGE